MGFIEDGYYICKDRAPEQAGEPVFIEKAKGFAPIHCICYANCADLSCAYNQQRMEMDMLPSARIPNVIFQSR